MKKELVKKGITKDILKNVFFQGISGVISKIGGLIFTVIIARLLFPELFGIYSLALTIILTLATLTDLGLNYTMTRYIADSLNRKNKKEARSRLIFLLNTKLVIALVFSILLFILSGSIASVFNKPALALPLQIGSIYLFVFSFYGTVGSLFLAVQKLKYNTLAETIFQISRVLLIFLFFYFYKTVASVFIVLSISTFLALLVSYIILNRKYGFLIYGKKEKVERRRLLTFSGFLAISLFSAVIFANIDKLMLGYFVPGEYIGYYTAIFTIVSGFLGLANITLVFFPVFTQIHGKRLKRGFKKTFRYLSMLAFPLTIGLSYVFLPALEILYGQEYVPPHYSFVLIITSIFLAFLILEGFFTSLYTILFNSKEKPKIPAITVIIVTILNLILNYIFISHFITWGIEYGLIGAAAATLISRYIYFGALIILCKKKFNIAPEKCSIVKPLFASIIMLLFLFIYDGLINLNIWTGILMIILAILIYLFLMFIIRGFKKEDFLLLKVFKN